MACSRTPGMRTPTAAVELHTDSSVLPCAGIIEIEVAGVVSRHPNNYTANGNPNAVMRQRVTCVSVGPPLADRRLPVEMTGC